MTKFVNQRKTTSILRRKAKGPDKNQVNENSKAEAEDMRVGDIVKSINGTNCDNMTHSEALSTIRRAGMRLQIVLERQDRNANDGYGNMQSYRSGAQHYDSHSGQDYQPSGVPGNHGGGTRITIGNNRRSRASQDDYDHYQQPNDGNNYQGNYQKPSNATYGQNTGGNYNNGYGPSDNNQNDGKNPQWPGKNSWVPNDNNTHKTANTNINDSRRQSNYRNRSNSRIRAKKSVASKRQFIQEFGHVNSPTRKLVKNTNSRNLYIPSYDDPLQPLPGHEPQEEPDAAPLSPILTKFEKPPPPRYRRMPTREGLRNVYSSPDYFSRGGFDNVQPINLKVPALNLLHRQRDFVNREDDEEGVIVHSAYRSKNRKKINKINKAMDGAVKDNIDRSSTKPNSLALQSPTTSSSDQSPVINSRKNKTTKINSTSPTRETTKLNVRNKIGSYDKTKSNPIISSRKENEIGKNKEKLVKPLSQSSGNKSKVVVRTSLPKNAADNNGDRSKVFPKKKNSTAIKSPATNVAKKDRKTTRLKIRKNNSAPESPTSPVEQINATSLEALESVDNNSSNEEPPPVRIPAKPDSYRPTHQDYEDDWSNNDQGGGFWPQKSNDRKEDDSSGGRSYNTLPNQRNQNSFQPIQPVGPQKSLSRTGSVKSLGNDYNQNQYNEQYDPKYQPRYGDHEDYRPGGGWQENTRIGNSHSKSTPSLAQPEDDNEPYGRNKYYDDRNDNHDSHYRDQQSRPFHRDDSDSRKPDSRKYDDDTDYPAKMPEKANFNVIDEKGLMFDPPSNYNIHDKTIPKCKAIYSFKPASKRELALKKGDLIILTKNVDKNWYEGELHRKRGIFPANYVEVVTSIKEALAAQCEYSQDGLGQARRDCNGITSKELSFSKGQIITLLKHVDANWFEGRLNSRSGLVPKKFLNVLKDVKGAGTMKQARNNKIQDFSEASSRPNKHVIGSDSNQYNPKAYGQSREFDDNNQQVDDRYGYYDSKPQYQSGDYNYQSQENDPYSQDGKSGRNSYYNKQDFDTRSAGGRDFDTRSAGGRDFDTRSAGGRDTSTRYEAGGDPYESKPQQRQGGGIDNRNSNNYGDYNRRSQRYQSETDYSDNHSQSGIRAKNNEFDHNNNTNYYNDGAADNSNYSQANTETSERYRAFYPYAPEKEDELELMVGDIIIVKEKCDDGWFVGSSTRTGLYGTFPGNFVEPVSIDSLIINY
ncbi:uncharacterized protein TRIADDRAFT_55897 [Trichoplax adhaerens]|uniref:SH3 domain-containing protein n=1 Tax=Trichoplax adhaerens TaxID=10228 RepID=B3RW62_TRIAD|nr:hypothetical protein TRIADDRAFT_55897 [Trichoplax adhaerens]EDV25610.1 hypothetical protein TRIADDRAFT_55897 [Trichoplax adhaerens]|eukprot:XP_002111643.1 hypothetical protein TRIADDRAFT_55897 [Trichoplax adhaerens]